MKQGWIAALVMALALGAGADIAEAKRLGSGGSLGMQRSMPAKSAPNSAPNATPNNAPTQNAAPAQQAAPAAAPGAGATPAAAPKRNWMGPIAGLAAGLGLAALLSHFGLGEAFASMMMTVLLVVAAIALVMFLVRRFGKPRAGAAQPAYAMAGAGAGAGSFEPPVREPLREAPREVYREATTPAPSARDSVAASFGGKSGSVADSFAAPAATAVALPADFDAAAFQRIARMIFIRMQAANDRGDLNDLRTFTTPEIYAHLQLDLQDRRGTGQQTEVLDIAAEVLDLARDGERDIVSVRYLGRVREEAGAPEVTVDEIWHLVRDAAEPQAWRIAGIQQTQ